MVAVHLRRCRIPIGHILGRAKVIVHLLSCTCVAHLKSPSLEAVATLSNHKTDPCSNAAQASAVAPLLRRGRRRLGAIYCDEVTDSFRVISPKDSRALA
jgi:hypothetical protein